MVRVADRPDAGSVFPFLFGAPARFLTPDSARGIELELSTLDPDLRRAFEDDLPFPEGLARVVGTALRARGGREIAFAAGEGKVRFAGEGGRFAGLGAFREPAEAAAFLGLEDGELEEELAASLAAAGATGSAGGPPASPAAGGSRVTVGVGPSAVAAGSPAAGGAGPSAAADAFLYLVLRWGYDLETSSRGALGLGAPGRLSLRGEGRREARYAVIRRLPAGTGARTAVAEAMDAWLLPRHLGPEMLPPPGTWLVAETEGRLALEMGARAGWRLEWLRATRAGGLAGDVGLRLVPRLDASVALETEGRMALVVERAASGSAARAAPRGLRPDRRVRLRVHRLRHGKRRFAFDLSATARAEPGAFAPPDLETLVRGLLGADAARALEDLAALERWTDPERLPGELADLGADYLRDLLSDLTGVDASDLEGWRRARETAVRFLRLWRELEAEAAAALLELAGEAAEGLVDLEAVRAALRAIAEGEGEAWRARLREALEGSDFGRSPAGRLVEALAGGGPVELLVEDDRLGALREAVRRVLRILDGSALQEVLARAKSAVDRRLDLSGAEEALLRGDPARLDRWLRKRLEEGLGEVLDLEALRRVHGALESFREKQEALYEASLVAVERRYRIRLAGALQRRRTREALADATFDLARAPALALYREAADGRLDLGLLLPAGGVRLHAATLTHRIERRTWIALSLPFADLRRQSLATSLARVAAIEEEDGRVLVYDVEAQDRRLRPGRRLSRLAVAGAVVGVAFGRPEPDTGATDAPGPAGGGLRIAEDGGLRFTYAHRTAVRNALPTALAEALRPMAALHLPGAFADLSAAAGANGRPDAAARSAASDVPPTLEAWLAEAEATLEARLREAMGGAPSLRRPEGRADLWVELEVALPLQAGAGWLRAPGEERDPRYLAMSRRLQARLKELALFHFFADPERYRELDRAAVVLAYASLPPTGSLEVRKGRLVETDREIHWDWPSRGLRRAVLFSGATELRLRAHLQRAHDMLRRTPGLKELAARYEPRDLERIRVRAFALDEPLLESLLFVEARTVKAARAAGLQMARFREEAGIRPAEALEALADFGARVTRAFHRKAPPWAGGAALRAVAPLAIAEAAAALAGSDAPAEADASAGVDGPAAVDASLPTPLPGSAASLTLHAVPPDADVNPGRFLGQGRPPPRRVRWLSRTVVREG